MLFRGNMWKSTIQRIKKYRKERKRSLNRMEVLFSPIDRLQRFSGKVSFCISLRKKELVRASLAAETALVLPVFFLGMITIISFMDIYRLQTEHLVKLCDSAKTAGMYAYVLDGSGPEEITLPDVYSYEPIGGLVFLPKVWMHNLLTVHAWTGKTYEAGETEPEEIEEMVYMTESGTVYHKNLSCSYLNLSVSQVSGSTVEYLKNAAGNHYGACASCSQGQAPAATVYVTEKGTSYHNLESCSALKRTVRMVKHSCTEGVAACSRCG